MVRRGAVGVALAGAAALGGLGGCSKGVDDAVVSRAQAALAPFKKELRATLQAALAQGPEAAITACAEVAPALAAKHSVGGATLGRTSTKLRNPKNAAAPWVMDIAGAAPEGPATVALPEGRVGYAEPIKVDDLCVMCHGQDVAPGIRERIAALYPDDRATGYAVGDVRGVFWVDLPAE